MNQPTSHNLPEYSVSEISASIKQHVEDRFGYVRVRGEISGLKIASSGHAYFKLKDDKAVLDGVSWKGSLAKMKFKPEDGLEVTASGRVTTYPGRSNYQIIVDKMEPAGEGALMALLEERKKALAKEGLFDEDRKKPLPFLPETIGVITSPTGAVIRDILHRIEERFPSHVLVWPVAVQGDGAAKQIADAINGFNALPEQGNVQRPDVLIVARGGGSIEDLWAFNEEVVVRAAAASAIPLISAVGHETDTTLIDYASDKRAPTPTAAAEIAVPVREELSLMVDERQLRFRRATKQIFEQKQLKLKVLVSAMPKPSHLMELANQRLDSISGRLEQSLPALLARKAEQLNALGSRLPNPFHMMELAQQRLENTMKRLQQVLPMLVTRKAEQLGNLVARLTPKVLLKEATHQQQQLSQLEARLTRGVKMLWKHKRDALEQAGRVLGSMSHESVLKRGFALVKNKEGELVSSAMQAEDTKNMQLQFIDGAVNVVKEE